MEIKGKVKATSGPNEYQGVLQIGFVLEGNEAWYNIQGKEGLLSEILKTIVIKGAEISFEEDSNKNITHLKMIKEPEKSDKKWEDDIVSFETLLTKAHALKKPFSIKTEKLELDVGKKYALFKAVVEIYEEVTEKCASEDCDGEMVEYIKINQFEAHGDATDDNVKGEHIKPHFIRMAETRAICRALRWYTNNGCAEEEK